MWNCELSRTYWKKGREMPPSPPPPQTKGRRGSGFWWGGGAAGRRWVAPLWIFHSSGLTTGSISYPRPKPEILIEPDTPHHPLLRLSNAISYGPTYIFWIFHLSVNFGWRPFTTIPKFQVSRPRLGCIELSPLSPGFGSRGVSSQTWPAITSAPTLGVRKIVSDFGCVPPF